MCCGRDLPIWRMDRRAAHRRTAYLTHRACWPVPGGPSGSRRLVMGALRIRRLGWRPGSSGASQLEGHRTWPLPVPASQSVADASLVYPAEERVRWRRQARLGFVSLTTRTRDCRTDGSYARPPIGAPRPWIGSREAKDHPRIVVMG